MDHVPKIMSTVGAAVLKDDTLLYVRQTYGSLKNKWTFPWGLIEGQNQDNSRIDTPDEAAVREALEEGGVHAEISGLVSFQNFVSRENVYMLIFVFLCDYFGGVPTPDGEETSESRFFTIKQLEQVKGSCDRYCHWLGKRILAGNYRILRPDTDNPYAPMTGFY